MQPHDRQQADSFSPSSSYEPTMDGQPIGREVAQTSSLPGMVPMDGRLLEVLKRLTLLLLLMGVFVAGCDFGSSSTASNSQTPTGSTPIPQLGPGNIEAVREAVIAKVQPAVVQINVKTGQGGGLGSGVIIDQRGYIITNNHVVQGAQSTEVILYGGERQSQDKSWEPIRLMIWQW